MIQKNLPDTIVERAAKITDAALLRQGRVHFLFYQVPLIPGENFSSFVDAVITAFTREGLSPRYLWFRTCNAIYFGLWLSEIFRMDFTPLFARINSLWTHYSFSPLYRLYDLFLDNSSMDINFYRNDLFSLVRNTAQGACVEGWHRRTFNSTQMPQYKRFW